MSLSRKKVEVDPLSFFLDEDQRKLHEEDVEEEELPVKQEIWREPRKPEIISVPTMKDIPPSNTIVHVEEKKSKGVRFEAAPPNEPTSQVKSALDDIKRTVSTSQKKLKDETPIDVLFSSEYNIKTEQLLNIDDDIFAVKENSPKSEPSSTIAVKLNADIDFKKTDDNDISDLKVAKLLEREQGLDESIFGNVGSTVSQNVIIQKKKSISALDSEQSFLKELDEITAVPRSKYVSSMSRSTESERSTRVTTNIVAEKKIDIDLNALDINSYINQETNDSGGGLFD